MEQEPLFFEDWHSALRHLVRALGGFESVGRAIWPAKKDAGDWLLDCLTADRRGKLDLDEIAHILRMGRERGIHIGLFQLCDELGYGKPAPVEPLDQQAEVNRQLDASLERLESLVERARKLREREPQLRLAK